MFVAFAPEHETIERETKALKLRLQVRVRRIFRFFVFVRVIFRFLYSRRARPGCSLICVSFPDPLILISSAQWAGSECLSNDNFPNASRGQPARDICMKCCCMLQHAPGSMSARYGGWRSAVSASLFGLVCEMVWRADLRDCGGRSGHTRPRT